MRANLDVKKSGMGAAQYHQNGRNTSMDPVSRSSHNKNDIFGNSYGLHMHQQNEEEVKRATPISSKARGLLPIPKDKNYESNKQIYADKLDGDSARLSQNSSTSALRNSPNKRQLRPAKMPKLNVSN